jgi:hypothetical protein
MDRRLGLPLILAANKSTPALSRQVGVMTSWPVPWPSIYDSRFTIYGAGHRVLFLACSIAIEWQLDDE